MKQKNMFNLTALLIMLMASPALAGNPPVRSYEDLSYQSVLHALLNIGKIKLDTVEFLDAYSMVAHCDVVQGSFTDEFRWNQAREAMRKWLKTRVKKMPTRLGVRSKIMFKRYDSESKYYLFADETPMQQVNNFPTNPRPRGGVCDKPGNILLPTRFQVITNNPITLPGLRLNEEQAKDLRQKFDQVGNAYKIAYVRFNIDIADADYIGPSIFATQQGAQDKIWRVKASTHSIEFFSDPDYTRRFFYYVPF